VLCEVCRKLRWTVPTKIQRETLPHALNGRDLIGLAETGSGKTGAFALPILNQLLESEQRCFALILTPTRELAIQIKEQFQALSGGLGVESAVLVGGLEKAQQEAALKRRPHILIATPGRLVDHLETTKGFSLTSIKYLVLDEADRILNLDYEKELDQILRVLPAERNTYLFSATMTRKVAKLQRASLRDPVRVEVSSKYTTVDNLKQHYLFVPDKFKDVYLAHILSKLAGNSFIVFTNTCNASARLTFMLRDLGLSAIPLFGKMNQSTRLGSLNKFKSRARSVLIATDVASRGLDIPHVDVVVNYDLPMHSKDYIHRVGRTARAGNSGLSITFVSQYDVELYQRIEHLVGKKLELFETDQNQVMSMVERVSEAQRNAKAVSFFL
jgi:ATP-dependent RNA helicase DDX47/RRP3